MNTHLLDEKPANNPYFIPCAVKALIIFLLSPFYIFQILWDLGQQRAKAYAKR